MPLEGYTSAVSVPPGGRIDFHMNCDAALDFNVQLRRVSRAAAVMGSGSGHVDPQPPAATRAHETGVSWPSAYSLQVPADWPSGIYRAQFTAGANQTSVSFIVRPARPASTSSILLEACTATEQAYNSWQDGNLYPSPGSPGAESRSRRVSLDHPVIIGPQTYDREEKFLLWLDDHGLVTEVCSGVDLHAGLVPLDRYALLLSVGHDEYWSREMRDAVEEFIAGGGNVAFFSGNTCWWQVRFEDDDRTMVCYKSAAEDPLTGVDDSRVTINWFDAPVNRPENSMTGVSFRNGGGHWRGGDNQPYTVAFAQHWVFDGTGLQNGQTFAPGLVGYEADGAQFATLDGVPVVTGRDGTPASFQVLATADLPWEDSGFPGTATMGVYQRGGTVFTAATTDWQFGLQDATVSRITQNVVQRLAQLKPPDGWEQVGHATNVTAMCGMYFYADLGPKSGRFLYASTGDNQLWRRLPISVNVAWEAMGEANSVDMMAAINARLYAITSDNVLWQRTAVPGDHWDQLGAAPDGTTALAALEGQLYVVTGDGSLHRTGAGAAPDWQPAGTPGPAVAMTAQGGRLVGVNGGGDLLSLDPATPGPWREVGRAPGMVALAAMDGRLFGADGAGRLWTHSPV